MMSAVSGWLTMAHRRHRWRSPAIALNGCSSPTWFTRNTVRASSSEAGRGRVVTTCLRDTVWADTIPTEDNTTADSTLACVTRLHIRFGLLDLYHPLDRKQYIFSALLRQSGEDPYRILAVGSERASNLRICLATQPFAREGQARTQQKNRGRFRNRG